MITVWHLFSAICLIASTVSANGTAKSQHATTVAYDICLAIGVLFGFITAFGNLACAKIVQRAVRDQGQSVKIAVLLVLLIASVGWIVLADLSGRWMSLTVLHLLRHGKC
jgi:Kef-type K+ transport system membrane component KefB